MAGSRCILVCLVGFVVGREFFVVFQHIEVVAKFFIGYLEVVALTEDSISRVGVKSFTAVLIEQHVTAGYFSGIYLPERQIFKWIMSMLDARQSI